MFIMAVSQAYLLTKQLYVFRDSRKTLFLYHMQFSVHDITFIFLMCVLLHTTTHLQCVDSFRRLYDLNQNLQKPRYMSHALNIS